MSTAQQLLDCSMDFEGSQSQVREMVSEYKVITLPLAEEDIAAYTDYIAYELREILV